jgi:hypothetical protein
MEPEYDLHGEPANLAAQREDEEIARMEPEEIQTMHEAGECAPETPEQTGVPHFPSRFIPNERGECPVCHGWKVGLRHTYSTHSESCHQEFLAAVLSGQILPPGFSAAQVEFFRVLQERFARHRGVLTLTPEGDLVDCASGGKGNHNGNIHDPRSVWKVIPIWYDSTLTHDETIELMCKLFPGKKIGELSFLWEESK